MDKLFLEVPFEIKAINDEDGTFEGYGSIFGNIDADGDVIEPGAFGKSLMNHKTSNTQPALLWMHDPYNPVGRYLEVREDSRGLYVKGQLILESSQGRDAYALLKGGAINGLSIGYVPKEWEFDRAQKARKLKEVDLWEVSLVTFPANSMARVMVVKNKITAGEVPSFRELEKFLSRECGMSRKESEVLLKSGYEAYASFATNQRTDDEEPDEDFESKGLSDEQRDALIAILKDM
ncbi:HK97 family phage prohead protease [Vampirovibrio chlorellavorus]|uniref:HK97 family phage prohead protease n=1 Tax=Vampirovibrio chlorellavorus TaxID=758823 RepID=UPI0026EA5A63|nr:HK97 family phage prohead protease [Vampirovibrio chlorellavorus]